MRSLLFFICFWSTITSQSIWKYSFNSGGGFVAGTDLQVHYIINDPISGAVFNPDKSGIIAGFLSSSNLQVTPTKNDRIGSISINPNPFDQWLEINSASKSILRVDVFSLDGKLFQSSKLNTTYFNMNTYSIPSGIWILKLYLLNNESSIYKLVKY